MRQAARILCEHLAIASVAACIAIVLLACLTDVFSPFDNEIAASMAKIEVHAPRVK